MRAVLLAFLGNDTFRGWRQVARADLLCDLIKYGLAHDDKRFIQSAEAVCAEEREKQHTVLANRIEKIVLTAANTKQKSVRNHTIVKSSGLAAQTLFIEKTPERRMGDLVLPEFVRSFAMTW